MKSPSARFAGVLAAPSLTSTRSLRRLDWRFLLPAPADDRFDHMVVLGGNEAMCHALTDVGWATYASASLAHVPSADAVVVLASAIHQLPRAVSTAANGAVLYVEVDRRSLGHVTTTPRSIVQTLRRAAFRPIGSYWVIPGFENALRYVPLGHAGSLTWYLRDVFRQSSFARAAASDLLRALASPDPRRVGALVPAFSIVAVKGERAARAVPAGVAVAAPQVVDRVAGVALITSGQDDGSRVVMLPFANDSDRPEAAIKIARHRIYNDRTDGEHAVLQAIRSRIGPALQDSVPTPERLFTWNGVSVAVESCAPGATIGARIANSRSRMRHQIDDLARTARWITQFNQACASPLVWSWSDKHRFIDAPLGLFRGTSPIDAACETLLADLDGRAAQLLGRTLPVVIQHNDLGPWNVHRDGERLVVIDWETEARRGDTAASRIGLPMTDLVYFATHWLFDVRRLRTDAERLEGFRDLFVRASNDPYTRAAGEVIDRYAKEMGISHEIIPLLVALTWIQRANDRLGRLRGDRADGEVDLALRRFRWFIDVLASSPRADAVRMSR